MKGGFKWNYTESKIHIPNLLQVGSTNSDAYCNPRANPGCLAPEQLLLSAVQCCYLSSVHFATTLISS